ncbi:MAG: endonuclease III domain-containing protein [Candidatus Cloacimonetes bacterium]|nr:endonuclease III domain-containing protein [Candidatus Cloacimonadota bacterium]
MSHSIWQEIYNTLLITYGNQHWWPADSPDEVIIGTILTQNTNWKNVEKAIAALSKEDACSLEAITKIDTDMLARLIKPAGYFNIKAKRLKAVATALLNYHPDRNHPEDARRFLLEINGVGPETADSILLYAYQIPTFVVDAYTKRVLSRLGMLSAGSEYEEIRQKFMKHLPGDAQLYNEYHALIVRHAKECCLSQPNCEKCVFNHQCNYRESQ